MSWRIITVAAVVLLAGCARHYTPEAVADPYGFFSGLWHGWVCPWAIMANVLSWMLSLLGLDVFNSIEIVGRPNTGFGYYAGFAMGVLSYRGAKGRSIPKVRNVRDGRLRSRTFETVPAAPGLIPEDPFH